MLQIHAFSMYSSVGRMHTDFFFFVCCCCSFIVCDLLSISSILEEKKSGKFHGHHIHHSPLSSIMCAIVRYIYECVVHMSTSHWFVRIRSSFEIYCIAVNKNIIRTRGKAKATISHQRIANHLIVCMVAFFFCTTCRLNRLTVCSTNSKSRHFAVDLRTHNHTYRWFGVFSSLLVYAFEKSIYTA